MLKQFEVGWSGFEDWYLEFPPSSITIHNLKTGKQVQEPSLVAVTRAAPEKLLAVGRAAQAYQDTPDAVVFSPFRQGQIAQYPAAQALIKALLKQAGLSSVPIPKPVLCVHIQEHTTQVEEQALAEAAIQSGAKKVFLYTGPLSAMLDDARKSKEFQHAVIIHIDPQN